MTEPLNLNNDRQNIRKCSASIDSIDSENITQNSRESISIKGGTSALAAPTSPIADPSRSKPSSSKPENQVAIHWSGSVNALLDQPPATLPQRLIYGGLAFCLVFGAWAWFGTVEEVGHAQGQLSPKGATYKIQPVELGKVSYIPVKEGDEVKTGQVLIEFDTELAQKEVERLQKAITALRLERVQKQALLQQADTESQTRAAIAKAEASSQQFAIALAREKATTARQLLIQQQIEARAYRDKKIRLHPLSNTSEKRLQQLQADKLAHQQRLERLKPLEEEGAVSQEYVFDAEQALRETEKQITQNQLQEVPALNEQLFQVEQSLRDKEAEMIQTQGDISAAIKEAERLEAELHQKQAQAQQAQLEFLQQRQQLKVDITQLDAKIAETNNLLLTAQAKLNYKYLKSPVDGVVMALDLKNPGEVLEAGKTVAEIVPRGVPLVLSAVLPNQEAGFVKLGMPVKVKLDAYPYQDYGVISGKVTQISQDAKADEKLGEVYRLEITLEQNYITDNHQRIAFKAGQTAAADIIIRRRRIIDVIVDPIKQIQKDGINL